MTDALSPQALRLISAIAKHGGTERASSAAAEEVRRIAGLRVESEQIRGEPRWFWGDREQARAWLASRDEAV